MTRKKVHAALMTQLAGLGAEKDHYLDMIGDYMKLWDVKTSLFRDIKKRGVTYQDLSSTGVMMMKNNPSVKEIVMVNKQMLSLLRELNLTTENAGIDDEPL